MYLIYVLLWIDLILLRINTFFINRVSDMSSQGSIQAADEAWGETCREGR